MKFNKMTLYKVPFDSDYKNVLSYREYDLSGQNLIPDPSHFEDDEASRERAFALFSPKPIYYNNSKYLSVKVSGEIATCSIGYILDDVDDYNYAIFEDTQNHTKHYFFVDSYKSENDSGTGVNQSCTFYLRMDFWNQYYTSIINSTPQQYELFAHDDATVFNSKQDSRLKSEYNYKVSAEMPFGDSQVLPGVILWLKFDIDINNIKTWNVYTQVIAAYYGTDGSDTGYASFYVPFAVVNYNTATNKYTFDRIIGVLDETVSPVPAEYIFTPYKSFSTRDKSSFFSYFSSQYLLSATFVFLTPWGVTPAENHIAIHNDQYWFKVYDLIQVSGTLHQCCVDLRGDKYYFIPSPFGDNAEDIVLVTGIVGSTKQTISPDKNKSTTFSFITSAPHVTSISADYDIENERKYRQFPFKVYSMRMNGSEINVTPKPSGTSTNNNVNITFQKLYSPTMRVQNTVDNQEDTFVVPFSNGSEFITSTDKYTVYAQTAKTGDTMRLVASSIESGLNMVAGTMTAGLGIRKVADKAIAKNAGGVQTGASAVGIAGNIIQYVEHQEALKHTVSDFKMPASNSIDNIYDIIPLLVSREPIDSDKESISAVWKSQGYPIMEYRPFKTRRFYHDYKQLQNPTFSNITNPLARDTISRIFERGVTIWHYNTVFDGSTYTLYHSTIGDYSKNNPNKEEATL